MTQQKQVIEQLVEVYDSNEAAQEHIKKHYKRGWIVHAITSFTYGENMFSTGKNLAIKPSLALDEHWMNMGCRGSPSGGNESQQDCVSRSLGGTEGDDTDHFLRGGGRHSQLCAWLGSCWNNKQT